MSDQKAFDTIADYVRTELFPCHAPFSQHVLLTLYRLIAKGFPVSHENLVAACESDTSAINKIIDEIASSRLQYDEAGGISAFAGLSQMPTNHRFDFCGRTLFTWCAFDALFLPELLGDTAQVSSICPVTGSDINMTVNKNGIEGSKQSNIVMSFTMPDTEKSCADLRGTFCNHVNFFVSSQAADIWLEENPGAVILGLNDAFTLGQIRNYAGFKDVLFTHDDRLGVETISVA